MKKLVLIFALVATVVTAKAWTGVVDGASTLIARKYMTPQALAEFDRILALKETVDYKWVALGNMKAHLTSDLQSTTTCDKDVVVRIEKAVEILRNRAKHSTTEQYKALVALQNLIIALHTIPTIAIEGVEHSQQDFEFAWTAGREGHKTLEKRGRQMWSKLWNNEFCSWHQGWSSEYYAYDINLRFGKLKEQAMQGSVRDWAHEMGLRAKPMYDWAKPDMLLRYEPKLNLEDTHLEMVARASFRLAALLNEALK